MRRPDPTVAYRTVPGGNHRRIDRRRTALSVLGAVSLFAVDVTLGLGGVVGRLEGKTKR